MPATSKDISAFSAALPFWMSLSMLPWIGAAAVWGGVWILMVPVWGLIGIPVLDALLGENLVDADPDTPEDDLFWYRLITWAWVPIQFVLIFGGLWWITATDHLGLWERIGFFFGIGVASGAIGIVYAHELMHQQSRTERWLGDILMTMVLYGHFRSEHLLVHHRYVGTPRDPVTARFNEGFHRFFPRILRACAISAFRAEKAMLARRDLPWHDLSNPFWRYGALQGGFLILAAVIGGWAGLGLFVLQACIAISHLELVNYIEHYGLTRAHLGDGKYEPVRPHHSWNEAHKASNWLLINLQRHSDHHYKPDRRFPLLQNFGPDAAPQLPYPYPVMISAALVPRLWRRMMNPRVEKWRSMYYPEIADWRPYNRHQTPLPKGAS